MQIRPADAAAYAAIEAAAKQSAEWLRTQRQDGVIPPAEKIILDCLRALRALPEKDCLYADELMDRIARLYMASCHDIPTERRRGFALLRIAAEVAE